MLYNLTLYSAVCQLYCNKAGRKKMHEGSNCLDSLLVYYNTSSKLINSSKPQLCCAVCRRSVTSDSLQPHGLQPARLLCPWDSPGKNTGEGCHALLQGIFQPRDRTQVSNPGLPPCRQILYHLSHQGRPRILEWVSYPFSREFPRPSN